MTDYKVPDLILNHAKVRAVLILESPHSDEVSRGYPLAGSSGRAVSRFLVRDIPGLRREDENKAFGCLIRCREVETVAVINCSQFPLNKTVYDCDCYREHAARIEGWDLIRRNPKSKRRTDKAHEELEAEIVRGLAERLQEFPETALLFPLGTLAYKLSHRVKNLGSRLYEGEIPHPSFNQWFWPRNQARLNAFREVFRGVFRKD